MRLSDNYGLLQALLNSKQVIGCFIFDPQQISKKNSYASSNAIQCMIKSLQGLDHELHKKGSRLYLFYGKPHNIIQKLIIDEKIDTVFVNQDYTPFSMKRDEAIEKLCIKHGVSFISTQDLLLNNPETIMSGNGTPYTIFTPFYKKSLMFPVTKPEDKIPGNFYSKPIKSAQSSKIFKKILPKLNPKIHVKGGRQEGLKLLAQIKKLGNYTKTHDIPALSTSNLSAHLKFGTISIREAYWHIAAVLGKNHSLLRQLYWRDFFTYITYHSPFVFGHAFHEKYDKLPWKNDPKDFKAWCDGKTGFPIVDAGMRQLNETGWMHNRVRMIVASFLIKDLHIDWRWGEKYFAQKLVDYDPAVNNGNWQWSASTGADAQPYFRIFNPWLQQKKFDPQCIYIKKWVPELKNSDHKIIHTWYNLSHKTIKNYLRPIVDHPKEGTKAKMIYKKIAHLFLLLFFINATIIHAMDHADPGINDSNIKALNDFNIKKGLLTESAAAGKVFKRSIKCGQLCADHFVPESNIAGALHDLGYTYKHSGQKALIDRYGSKKIFEKAYNSTANSDHDIKESVSDEFEKHGIIITSPEGIELNIEEVLTQNANNKHDTLKSFIISFLIIALCDQNSENTEDFIEFLKEEKELLKEDLALIKAKKYQESRCPIQ